MSGYGKAVICSGIQSNFQVCADKLFLSAPGYIWSVSKFGVNIVYNSEEKEGFFTDCDGQVFAVEFYGIYRVEVYDAESVSPATVQTDSRFYSVAYGDLVYTGDRRGYPELVHTLKRESGQVVFQIKERCLSFVGFIGGLFIFYRQSLKEFFAVGEDGLEQRLYWSDKLTHIQRIDNFMLISVQVADSQARCDVYDLIRREVVDSYVIDSDSDGFSDPVDINGESTFLWCDELFLLAPSGLIRIFPGRKIRSYLPAKEGVYISFEEESFLYLYSHDFLQVNCRLPSPIEGYRFALLEAFGDGLACCLFNAERICGLAYVLFISGVLDDSTVDLECESRLFEYAKRYSGESFAYVITFARDVPYDTLVRQAFAAVDEAFAYFSEQNPETLLFDGHVEAVLDGRALSQEQKRALVEGCNKIAQEYFYRINPVTDEAFNVSVIFNE